MKRFLVTAAVVLLCAGVSTSAWPQSQNATLGGTVVDASGALIPGVEVTATNDATGIVTKTLSNEAGSYQFASLQPGTYTVIGTLAGFQTQTYKQVALGISQQVRLNFTLQVGGAAAQSVEVTVAADTLIATTSASVGNVLPDYKVNDLPMQIRNVLDLVKTTPGVGGATNDSFAGLSNTFTMTTRDGISINNGRSTPGSALVFASTFSSPDLVEQVRIITSPADAEVGRGSGQVQLQTRSGTNVLHGAVFLTNRNAVWDANTSSNNFKGVGTNYINRNQFGWRAGGPIVKNKTFFFFLYEGQRRVQRTAITAPVLTDLAKTGIFRYVTGRQNGNFTSPASTRSVERDGSLNTSLNPANLRQVNVFGYDPLRPGPDPSGYMKKFYAGMPKANDFTVGDGLNTAGFTWVQKAVAGGGTTDGPRDGVNLKIDHQFNVKNKISLVASREHDYGASSLSSWPNGFAGTSVAHPAIYTASFVSTLSPTMLNEFRFGLRRNRLDNLQAWDNPVTGQAAQQQYMGFSPGPGGPVSPGGTPFRITTVQFEHNYGINETNGSVGNTEPLWTLGNNLSKTRGAHAFKGGAEFRHGNGNAWNSDEILPAAQLGPNTDPGVQGDYYCPGCGIPVSGISTTTLPGIASQDVQHVIDLLNDQSGSVANISQAFSLKPDPKNLVWYDYPNYYKKYRNFIENEWMAFFKDDWKVTRNLTLNLGVRWEWFGVPYEGNGMMARPKGGNVFGLSGSSFADWFKPGIRGTLTTTEFTGKYSANPNIPIYNNDWNNFGPAVGFSWSIPWFAKDKTVLRGGYGVNYQGIFAGGGLLGIDINVGTAPGVNQYASHPTTQTSQMNISNVSLPIPERYANGFLPVVSVLERSQSIVSYDVNQRSPYAQNFNLEMQHQLGQNLTVEVRYIGTKGTKLTNSININTPIVVENGLMDAIGITRAGGDAPLFDSMLKGLVFAGIGTVGVNGLSGSSALRQFSGTRTNIANGAAATVATFLNTNSSFTGQIGGMLRNGGLPENFVSANPQYGGASIAGSGNNSTYHSMQAAVTKRLSQSFTSQTTYTWSRAIGTTGSIDPRHPGHYKSLSANQRTNDIRTNGTWQLPFGPGKALLNNPPGWVSRLVEAWQFGGIANWTSGAPLTITAGSNPLGGSGQFPNIIGPFPRSMGKLTASTVAGNRTYFSGLQRVADPGLSAVTSANSLSGAYSQFAIADSGANILLQHAAYGQIGNMGPNWIQGPSTIGFDLNMIKRFRVAEQKTVILRLDAINVLNHPNWGNPGVNVDLSTFGLVGLPTTGNRQFTFNARMEF